MLSLSESDLPNKRPLSALVLENKKEGFYTTGIAGPFSSPDFGIGGAAVLGFFFNGGRQDRLFRYRPYEHRIALGVFAASKGYREIGLGYDGPYLGHSLYRLRTVLSYSKNTTENYFGRGESSLQALTTDTGEGFRRYDDFAAALERPDNTGMTSAHYQHFQLERRAVIVNLERDILGGFGRIQAGVQISHLLVEDYTGQAVALSDEIGREIRARQRPTALRRDADAGGIIGFSGGDDHTVNLGLALDNRDFEANAKSGWFADLTANFSSRQWGSAYNYQKVTVSPRWYLTPFSFPLTLAQRFAATACFDEAPFYAMDRFYFSDRQVKGLGGRNTLRGYRQNRYVGPVNAVYSLELRFTFAKFRWWGQYFEAMFSPFLDSGRVFDAPEKIRIAPWKTGGGAGLRLAWNQSTIILMDYGIGEEGESFYFDVDHPF